MTYKRTYNSDRSGYKPRSPVFLGGVVKWWRANCCMSDWDLQLSLDPNPPDWVDPPWYGTLGRSSTSAQGYAAMVWLNLAACRRNDCDPMGVLFHELGHVWLYANDLSTHSERLVNLLEAFFVKAFYFDRRSR